MSGQANELVLRNGKRVTVERRVGEIESVPKRDSTRADSPETPVKSEAPKRPVPTAYLLLLPDEILSDVLDKLDGIPELCNIECVAHRMKDICSSEVGQKRWFKEFATTFLVTDIQRDACKLAGGWKALYASKVLAQREATPFEKPSPFEVTAAIQRLVPPLSSSDNATSSPSHTQQQPQYSSACVVFLVDGSGSVTEDDFACMTEFMLSAREHLTTVGGSIQLSVVQFSNDVRVELPPTAAEDQEFSDVVRRMHRMNGGTNISMAIVRAGQLLKPLPSTTARVLVLLTDGRIDSHQAVEAHNMAARLSDEQGGVSLHAFGVGRGVDKHELMNIISAQDAESAESRYLELCVLEDAPW